MNRHLLCDRRFWPHFWTQFCGAFNDNLFKNALVVLITFKAFSIGGLSPQQTVAVCGGIFILPFFLFSAAAGQLADKLSKSRLVVWIKIGEIIVMLLGGCGLVFENMALLLAALFLMGLQSAFFGPIKYSILPQLLREKELVAGNAWIETGTFIAILAGTILGGILIAVPHGGTRLASAAVLTIALLGLVASLKVDRLEPAAPGLKLRLNPVTPTLEILGRVQKMKTIFLPILGISWFWFIGASFLALLPSYCKDFLAAEPSVVVFFLALFSCGVGLGSLLCERLSLRRLELALVPIGSLGMSLFAFDLFLTGRPSSVATGAHLSVSGLLAAGAGWRIVLDLFLFSLSGGLFIVPLYTLVQLRSEAAERSRIIAANNILNALFMVAAALFLVLLFALQLGVRSIFLVLAVMNTAVAVYICTVIPEFLLRFLCRLFAKTLYRISVSGAENMPVEGPAVLVCNHVSFIDWLIIAGICLQPVRFVMHYSYYRVPFLGRIFKAARVIPIAGAKENPQILRAAFERIAGELAAGQIVCIFPEGTVTKDGEIGPFRNGIERIIRRSPVPVIPMAIDGLCGSIFSRKHGQPLSGPFRRFWSAVTLRIGGMISPEDVSAPMLRQIVGRLKLGAEAAYPG